MAHTDKPHTPDNNNRAVILTALQVEYLAVRAQLSNLHETVHEKGTVYEEGVFTCSGGDWQVCLGQVGAGNPAAAAEAERAIAHFHPSVVLFVGVAGGIKDVHLGDVIAGTKIYEYESGKDRDQFHPRPELFTSSYPLVERAKAEAKKTDWLKRLTEAHTTQPPPRVVVGPLAAGAKVIASTRSATMALLKSTYSDALGVEMEGFGFLRGVYANSNVNALVVRGISDLLDGKEEADSTGSQIVAANHASAFAVHVLSRLHPVRSSAESSPGASLRTPSSPAARSTDRSVRLVGNILGAPRAEADVAMLNDAFVETADFKALTDTTNFNFVVGRRGTGKSALFDRVPKRLQSETHNIVLLLKPAEHQNIELQQILQRICNSYREARNIMRLLWKVQVLSTVLDKITGHYKLKDSQVSAQIAAYRAMHSSLFASAGLERATIMLRAEASPNVDATTIPSALAAKYQLEQLTSIVRDALSVTHMRAFALYDGLDEGWIPTPHATAILGGLAICAADLSDNQSGVHCLLFIRDNMFRALAQLDNDYSRHVEGHTLRLHWSHDSLFHLIAERLRVAFQQRGLENDLKVWNRFAQRGLQDRDGFERCLKYTLYRPRDVLVLLNSAFQVAAREKRQAIVEGDIDATAKKISQDRLNDLVKEYDTVLPGMRHFAELFRGGSAVFALGQALTILDGAARDAEMEDAASRDFPLLGSGREMFSALYSVGFLGVHNIGTDRFVFCHDGSNADTGSFAPELRTIIHPCYWRALDLDVTLLTEDVAIQVYDDYEEGLGAEARDSRIQDQRMRRLGQIQGELPRIPNGEQGRFEFEQWVHTALRILFSGKLTKIRLQAAPWSGSVRDIVANNVAASGFWARMRQDFEASQCFFHVSPFPKLTIEDFSRALTSDSKTFGRVAFYVTRGTEEGLLLFERQQIRDLWKQTGSLLVPISAELLTRAIRKLRAPRRFDYADDAFGKRVETIQKTCTSGPTRKYRRRRR